MIPRYEMTPEVIWRIRFDRGENKTQFAARLGVSWQTVTSWESGKRHPDPVMVQRLNEAAAEAGIGESSRQGGEIA